MTDEEIMQGLENACNSATGTFGWTVPPYPILRDYILKLQAENAALRERLEKAIEIPFKVIDKLTGDEADIYNIALNEKWASHLVYCDMEGFAVEQDGSLVLLDECDHMAYPSADRFEIISEKRLAELKGQK